MWEYILRYASFLSPSRIIIDFEKAAFRSIQTKFKVNQICVLAIKLIKILTLVELTTIQQEENPFFSIDLWNTYESTLAGLCRTNNNVEGGHNSFSKIIDEGYHLLAVQQLNQGQTLRIQKRKYRELHERISRIVQSYNLQNIIQYLKNIINNLTI
ncbi:hypothetical protein HZS_6077 [Henneguya salminicola]|nr:hypothetical protein HZS_6077 [Henneguya salminicola]